jgi:GTP-binding protein
MWLENKTKTNRLAIIGRPNVGKSTLFNILTGTRKAVVKDQSGVTRDIQIEPGEWLNRQFDVLDTGGLTEAEDIFSIKIREQVLEMIDSVDVIIMVVDGRSGMCPEDREVCKIIQQSQKPFCVAVNKIDRVHDEDTLKSEFYEFNENVFPCSFEQRRGITEILEWAVDHFVDDTFTYREGLTIAIVGKPNVGKSSLSNQLLGENRMLVSDIAGTTVDSIDSEFIYNEKKYILIDTAGIRKRGKMTSDVEVISTFKSQSSIQRADLVLLMVDGLVGPSDQDTKLVEFILKQHKPVILVANKLDLCEEQIPEFRKQFRQNMAHEFHFFTDIPICFISAKTTSGVKKLFETIEEMEEKLNKRISTSKLNDFFFNVIRKAPSPVYQTRDVKFFYLTQTQQKPPSFIAFSNAPDGVTPSYRRFLAKNLKEEFGLEGMPIRIFAMKSQRRKKNSKVSVANEFETEMLESENDFDPSMVEDIKLEALHSMDSIGTQEVF